MDQDPQSQKDDAGPDDPAAKRLPRKDKPNLFRFETHAPVVTAFVPTMLNATIPSTPAPTVVSAAPEIRLNKAVQDLSGDKLLTTVPRSDWNGNRVPVLNGIPLLAKLGAGGMGAVYYGWHPERRCEVAVKVLPFQMAHQEEMVVRFQREARVAAGISSPHLVSVFDIHQEHDLFFMVMEFVNGCSAGDILKKALRNSAGGLPEAEALDITIAATRGVVAAHAADIVHRDIKPDNIFVPRMSGSEKPELSKAKLGDLGLARSQGDATLTVSQVAMGTPGFMAPEQSMDAKRVGKPADIFSLGATLYALLAARPPFTGESLMEVLLNTVNKPPPPIRSLRSDIPLHCAAVIQRCLEKDPTRRFPSAEALLEALVRRRAELPGGSPEIAGAATVVRARPADVTVASRAPSSPHMPDTIVAAPPKVSARLESPARQQPAQKGGALSELARGNRRWPNLVVTLLFVYIGLSQVVQADYVSWLGWLAIGLHDFGHLIGNFFGETLFVLGGVLCPFVMIGAGLWFLYKHRFHLGAAFCLGWLGTWMHFSGRYIESANDPQFDLHRFEPFEPLTDDWGWLLAHLRLLKFAPSLATLMQVAGHLSLAVAVCGCLYLFIAKLNAGKR